MLLKSIIRISSFLAFLFVFVQGGPDDRAWSYTIAPHRLFVVPLDGSLFEISLPGYDLSGSSLEKTTITSLPSHGTLYQLSQIYNDHGYDPKAGLQINQTGTVVSGSKFRLLYSTGPTSQNPPFGKLDSFTYTAKVVNLQQFSADGTVTLVSPNGVLVGSSFAGSAEGWQIIGNRLASNVLYDKTSRGLQSRYIYGSDDLINKNTDTSGEDQDLWYFQAPPPFLGNQGIAYGGSLTFTLSSFSGDFSSTNLNKEAYIVYLECKTCDSNKGVRLGMPLSKAFPPDGGFTGLDAKVILPLKEEGGWLQDSKNILQDGRWLQDSKNILQPWSKPSRCTFIQVLSALSNMQILGDYTKWHESIGLDNVAFINLIAQLPICAQGSPNAYQCTCA